MHINQELLKQKIPILSGRASENNRQVLEALALNGPLLKYDVHKRVGGEYSTVSRRIDDLRKKGYLVEAGQRETSRGKQEKEALFGLSWAGFVTCLSISEIRKDILNVIEINLDSLDFKIFEGTQLFISELYPEVRKIIESLYNREQIEVLAFILFKAYLESSTPIIENLNTGNVLGISVWKIEYVNTILSNIGELPEGESIPVMDIIGLIDNAKILHLAQICLPKMAESLKEGLENQYRIFVHIPSEIANTIHGLKPEDKPSFKVKEFLERELSRTSFSLEVKE